MSNSPARRAPARSLHAASDPFAFPAQAAMDAATKHFALMWSLPLRTMMVVMSEAVSPSSRR
ncbi:MAG: hypothetical protein AAF677_08920 [Pseudomonadota bacterium]